MPFTRQATSSVKDDVGWFLERGTLYLASIMDAHFESAMLPICSYGLSNIAKW